MTVDRKSRRAPPRGKRGRSQKLNQHDKVAAATDYDPAVTDDWEPNVPVSLVEIEAIDQFLAMIVDVVLKNSR